MENGYYSGRLGMGSAGGGNMVYAPQYDMSMFSGMEDVRRAGLANSAASADIARGVLDKIGNLTSLVLEDEHLEAR